MKRITSLFSTFLVVAAAAAQPGPASPEHDAGWFSIGAGPSHGSQVATLSFFVEGNK